MGLGPFDLTGGPFLTLYAALFGIAAWTSSRLARTLRPEGRSHLTVDDDELAYLAGGSVRLADAAVVRLLARGSLKIEQGKLIRQIEPRQGVGAVERAVLETATSTRWSAAWRKARSVGTDVQSRLIAAGLTASPGELMRLRLWQGLPFLLLLGFGLIKLKIGMLRDKPVGFLAIFLLVTFFVALVRLLGGDRRTKAGQAFIQRERQGADRMRRAPVRDEMGTAVALFGTGVLTGSAFDDFHKLRSAAGGDAGVSSTNGCGGGGCGGGCGGCGGCGGS